MQATETTKSRAGSMRTILSAFSAAFSAAFLFAALVPRPASATSALKIADISVSSPETGDQNASFVADSMGAKNECGTKFVHARLVLNGKSYTFAKRDEVTNKFCELALGYPYSDYEIATPRGAVNQPVGELGFFRNKYWIFWTHPEETPFYVDNVICYAKPMQNCPHSVPNGGSWHDGND